LRAALHTLRDTHGLLKAQAPSLGKGVYVQYERVDCISQQM